MIVRQHPGTPFTGRRIFNPICRSISDVFISHSNHVCVKNASVSRNTFLSLSNCISIMGLFSRKKNASSSASSPSQSPIPTAHPSPTFPSLSLNDLEVPPTVLRVALDPAPVGAASAGGLFYVSVNPGDDVSAIRRAVIEKLGNVSMGLFKVCFLQCILTKAHPIQVAIPWQARQQARAYTEQYDVPVNLIASFPSYNLDDPEQFAQSLGLAGWQSAESNTPSTITIDDWFPSSVGRQSDMISVLVRTDFGVSSGKPSFICRLPEPFLPNKAQFRSPLSHILRHPTPLEPVVHRVRAGQSRRPKHYQSS